VFDDFLAAAEWLVANRWTNPGRLAIAGGSNGGLLVAAALVQRPDLFGAVHANVGVLDMLRFHRFTIGWAWAEEYGSPDDPAAFAALRAYSPLHNLREGERYPATLVTTADHDDRVFPAHSYKFAAALQAAQGGSAPVLLRVESQAGHGRGTPTSKEIDAAADSLAFLVHNLGVDASALPAPREAQAAGGAGPAR
jgi:prolyl oligopeptidase